MIGLYTVDGFNIFWTCANNPYCLLGVYDFLSISERNKPTTLSQIVKIIDKLGTIFGDISEDFFNSPLPPDCGHMIYTPDSPDQSYL